MQAPDDLRCQQDEMSTMSSILHEDEFSIYSKSTALCAILVVQMSFQSRFVFIDKDEQEHPVDHLPPIQLIATVPQDYPSQSCPSFTLSCCWLSKSKLDLLAVKLERLWEETHGEILHIWFLFLQNDALEYLKINDGYDLSEECQLNIDTTNPTNKINCMADVVNDNNKHCDKTANVCNSMRTKEKNEMYCLEMAKNSDSLILEKETLVEKGYELMKSYHCKKAFEQIFCYLLQYNKLKTNETFNKAMQDCNICYSSIRGKLCCMLNCGHVSCTECLKLMCEVHIKDGSTKQIKCAETGCVADIPNVLIKDLVTKELYDKFDQILLNEAIAKLSNNTYCPRISCQYPISNPTDDNGLAVCPSCKYSFCAFCKKSYHGVENCNLNDQERKELTEAYKNGSYDAKLKLEKLYGKKQLTELVSTAESMLWMEAYCKKCPVCCANIEKKDGCNKVVCIKCCTPFCWLCLTRLPSVTPYNHFQDPSSKCFNQLFEAYFSDEEENV